MTTLRDKNLGELAEDAARSFFGVGGTWEMVRGDPCRTVFQAHYLGQWQAYARVLYNMDIAPSELQSLFKFAERDADYAEYV